MPSAGMTPYSKLNTGTMAKQEYAHSISVRGAPHELHRNRIAQ
jgi:hypothetical protein